MVAPNVLITGFGPFPDVPVNASAALARRLAAAARRRFPFVRISSCILPTEWAAAPLRLDTVYARHDPRIALHFGVSSRASGLEIERVAVNRCVPKPDASGRLPTSESIRSNGAETLETSLPVSAILERLSALSIRSSTSDDAGQYLCNAILYHSADLASRRQGAMAGFVHIPTHLPATASDAPHELTMQDAVRGGLAILDVCLAALEAPKLLVLEPPNGNAPSATAPRHARR